MTLTTALMLLGLAVLLALALQGWWNTRRLGTTKPADSRLPAERVEPPMGEAGVAEADGAVALPRPATRRQPRLDALIDAIVPMALDAPISGELALSHLPPSRRVGSKAMIVEGLDTQTGQWDTLSTRPPLQRVAGRCAAGQPQRAAQRD